MTSKVDELREALFVNWMKIEGASSDTYNQHALLELDDLIAAVKAEGAAEMCERCAKYLDEQAEVHKASSTAKAFRREAAVIRSLK